MKKALLIVAMMAAALRGQTIPSPLQVSRMYNITSGSQVIDNRSQSSMNCNYFSYLVTSGVGTWATELDYSDVSNAGPWTSFGASGTVNYLSSPAIGYGNGRHNWVRVNTTGGTTVSNFSCSMDYYLSTSLSGGAVGWNSLTTGTNSGQTLNVGTGSVLTPTGTGVVNANEVEAVPFCTGFLPTSGQAIQYTTASSPNPCWTSGASVPYISSSAFNYSISPGGTVSPGMNVTPSLQCPAGIMPNEIPITSIAANANTYAVTGVLTNSNPLKVTCSGCNIASNTAVVIVGAVGEFAVNGRWIVTNVDANHFTLNGSYPTGRAWSSGGTIYFEPVLTVPSTAAIAYSNAHNVQPYVTVSYTVGSPSINGKYPVIVNDGQHLTLIGATAQGTYTGGYISLQNGGYAYLSGGAGTAETVPITGGTCNGSGTTGTIRFTAANSHSGAFTMASATSGIYEAIWSTPSCPLAEINGTSCGGTILVSGVNNLYGPLEIGDGDIYANSNLGMISQSGVPSRQGITLLGMGNGAGNYLNATIGQTSLRYVGAAIAYAPMVDIAGNHDSIQNMLIENYTYDQTWGVRLLSAIYAKLDNVTIYAEGINGIGLFCDGTCGYDQINNIVIVAQNTGGQGMVFTRGGLTDQYGVGGMSQTTISNFLSYAGPAATDCSLSLNGVDSNTFSQGIIGTLCVTNVEPIGYTTAIAPNFPSGNQFLNVYLGNSPYIVNGPYTSFVGDCNVFYGIPGGYPAGNGFLPLTSANSALANINNTSAGAGAPLFCGQTTNGQNFGWLAGDSEGADVVSAATIYATGTEFRVSGSNAISNIFLPSTLGPVGYNGLSYYAPFSGQVCMEALGAWTTVAATTAVTNGTTTSPSTVLHFASAPVVAYLTPISGVGIAPGTWVLSTDATSVTMSTAPTATITLGETIYFGNILSAMTATPGIDYCWRYHTADNLWHMVN